MILPVADKFWKHITLIPGKTTYTAKDWADLLIKMLQLHASLQSIDMLAALFDTMDGSKQLYIISLIAEVAQQLQHTLGSQGYPRLSGRLSEKTSNFIQSFYTQTLIVHASPLPYISGL